MMIMMELLIQLTTCIIKSEREQERISSSNYLREFKLLMRQMFWIGRYDPSVMEESMHELKHHIYAKDKVEVVDRLKHEKQMSEMTIERDQLKLQVKNANCLTLCDRFDVDIFSVWCTEKYLQWTRTGMSSANNEQWNRSEWPDTKAGRVRRRTGESDWTDPNRRTERYLSNQSSLSSHRVRLFA